MVVLKIVCLLRNFYPSLICGQIFLNKLWLLCRTETCPKDARKSRSFSSVSPPIWGQVRSGHHIFRSYLRERASSFRPSSGHLGGQPGRPILPRAGQICRARLAGSLSGSRKTARQDGYKLLRSAQKLQASLLGQAGKKAGG